MEHSWLEINLKNIKKNTANLKEFIGPEVGLLAVVKSNGYGHGLVEVAKTVSRVGADFLGVDNIEEGVKLRKAKIRLPILVFGYPETEKLEEAVARELTLTLWDKELARALSRVGHKLAKPVKIHIKVDTGMHRFGLAKEGVLDFIQYLKRTPKIEIEGIYSHFASAQDRDKSYTFKQLGIFQEVLAELQREGIKIPLRHIANSAATLGMTSTHLDMVRLGITIYGLFPAPELGSFFDLRPALTWKTKIVQIKKLGGGEKVGYSGTYTTPAPANIAVIPVGYADGLDRGLSNLGKVLVSGKRVPIIGRICMRATMIDISGIEDVKVGDEVVLIGQQGLEIITAGELAGYLGTTNYEIVTRIAAEIPKIYIE